MALNRCDELFLEFAKFAQWDETDSDGNILSTGFPEWDKDKFDEFVDKHKDSLNQSYVFVVNPDNSYSLGTKADDTLKKCLYNKVLNSIIKRFEVQFRKDDFSLERFVEMQEPYFEEFNNLEDEFNARKRIFKHIEKNKNRKRKREGEYDSGEHSKYKRFLEREPVSHLKMLLKQAGYKGFAKMNKRQLIAVILKEVNA